MAGDPVEQESSVVRYYTSQLLLRVVASDDYDADGASFSAFGAADRACFLSVAEPQLVPPLMLRSPSVVVVPPPGDREPDGATRGVFTVLPAEGFVKEPGQPVYYNEPIELMDQHGRLLGIVARAPFAGHLAADGHSGALVFVLERHKSRVGAISAKFLQRELKKSGSLPLSETSEGSSNASEPAPRRRPARRSSLIEVCGGERLRIPGLVRAAKKQFPGTAIMKHKADESKRARRKSIGDQDQDTPYLTCEIVLTSPSAEQQRESLSFIENPPTQPTKKGAPHIADRTATGEYVGILHSGILHRRSDHMKLWKKRFFVLTQVALHRFDVHETLATIRTQKSRGSIYLKDCRGVRYERFSRPHELEIELNNGKVFSLHAVDALTCSDWASVLSRAIENPQWVHAESEHQTVWRSDHRFESSRCPAVTKVVLRRGKNKLLGEGLKTISRSPQWSEKLSLGSITVNGFVMVQLADGNAFRITLEDLTKALVHPSWTSVSTSIEVARIQSLDEDTDDLPDNLQMPLRKSELVIDEKSPFLVRLKFQSDLQLDQRLTRRRSIEREKRILFGVLSCVVLLPAIAYAHRHTVDNFARSLCVVTSSLIALIIAVFSPVVWHIYLWMVHDQSIEGELHWFLTLLALEVRPRGDQGTDRFSTSSGEDGRTRIESFNYTEEDDESDDGVIVVPTKTPLYGFDQGQTKRPSGVASPQAIRKYRLENALDSILSRPQLSFFAIKNYFPTQFLRRDEKGRRVLLISLNKVDRKALAAHNVSGFNVGRFFMYLWEFIWSYQDMQEGVAHSQLVMLVDCTGWQYFNWFGIECEVMMQLLDKTFRMYPGRLARVIFARDRASFGVYGELIGKGLDPELLDIVETHHSIDAFVKCSEDGKLSKDEAALNDFVNNVLATHANVTIPSFTRRELEQAARFAMTGSLKEDDGPNSKIDAIGTRAVVMPAKAEKIEWDLVLEEDDIKMWRSKDCVSPVASGKTYQSDSQVGQWRGRLAMKSTHIEEVIKLLRDPARSSMWMDNSDEVKVLEKLSRQEETCHWSRRVPFMNFSLSGHRDGKSTSQKNPFFHCVMRRIHDLKKGRGKYDRIGTVMWKTTSAQRVIVDPPTPTTDTQRVQWRKLEDPFVSLCFVIEEHLENSKKQLTLSIWFQSFAPPTTPKQATEIARLIARKLRALDDAVGKAEQAASFT